MCFEEITNLNNNSLKYIMKKITSRQFKLLNENLVELKCFDTVYCNMNGSIDNPISVDPDGGPYIKIGQILTFGNNKFVIEKIKSYNHDNLQSLLTVLFDVKRI